jgi:hypothetical protein
MLLEHLFLTIPRRPESRYFITNQFRELGFGDILQLYFASVGVDSMDCALALTL